MKMPNWWLVMVVFGIGILSLSEQSQPSKEMRQSKLNIAFAVDNNQFQVQVEFSPRSVALFAKDRLGKPVNVTREKNGDLWVRINKIAVSVLNQGEEITVADDKISEPVWLLLDSKQAKAEGQEIRGLRRKCYRQSIGKNEVAQDVYRYSAQITTPRHRLVIEQVGLKAIPRLFKIVINSIKMKEEKIK